jgi:tRNA A-37 threonylcarbamoyl transferase component Bud32
LSGEGAEDRDSMNVPPTGAGSAVAPAPGEDRLGRYILRRRIGKGAMGEVWRGEDPEIAREVAVKVLRVPEGLSDQQGAEWRSRFLREARAAGRLSHPGIVAIHDVGEAGDGRLFIVMELVHGQGLDEILKGSPPPQLDRSLEWVAQLADALDSAHRREIVHRDVKPANILIDEEGRARLVDFGIARLSESELTREGCFLGSPAFASPEQVRGEVVDGRSDLFSLGAVLYTLLAGQRPFRGEELSTLVYEICHVEPLPPSHFAPHVPRSFGAIALKALAKKPGDRYPFGRDMAADLRAAASGREPVLAAAASVVEKTVGAGVEPPTSANARGKEELERQAAAAGSAVAVAVTRAAVQGAATARWLARNGAQWARAGAESAQPVALRAGSAAAVLAERLVTKGRDLWSRGWRSGSRGRAVMMVLFTLALGAAIYGGYTLVAGSGKGSDDASRSWRLAIGRDDGSDAPWHASGGLLDRLMGRAEGSSASLTVRVTHGLTDGEITVWSGKKRVLNEDLEADEKEFKPFGTTVFSYHRATTEWSIRVPAGAHDLRVRVQSNEKDLDLVRNVSGSLAPDGHYVLDIDVTTWPIAGMELDWAQN